MVSIYSFLCSKVSGKSLINRFGDDILNGLYHNYLLRRVTSFQMAYRTFPPPISATSFNKNLIFLFLALLTVIVGWRILHLINPMYSLVFAHVPKAKWKRFTWFKCYVLTYYIFSWKIIIDRLKSQRCCLRKRDFY